MATIYDDFKVSEVRKILHNTYRKLLKLYSRNSLKQKWIRKIRYSILQLRMFFTLDKCKVETYQPLTYKNFMQKFYPEEYVRNIIDRITNKIDNAVFIKGGSEIYYVLKEIKDEIRH